MKSPEELDKEVSELRDSVLDLTSQVKGVAEKLTEKLPPVTPATEEAGSKEQLKDSSENTDLQELQAKNAELSEAIDTYRSPAYAEEIIRRWARGITPEDYVVLGLKLGYNGLLAQEAVQDPDAYLGEVELEDSGSKVLFSDSVPEGESGWEKSETLGCFVKVVS